MPDNARTNSYLWCDTCRRSFSHSDAPKSVCPMCGNEMRPTSKVNAILRGLMANEMSPSPIVSKHRQIVKLIWTRNGMGEQYYRVLAPDMSYSKFESAMTKLLCKGADDGWVSFVIPAAPKDDESQYQMKVLDENRFLAALQSLAGPDASIEEGA
jgi:hypothetical protein